MTFKAQIVPAGPMAVRLLVLKDGATYMDKTLKGQGVPATVNAAKKVIESEFGKQAWKPGTSWQEFHASWNLKAQNPVLKIPGFTLTKQSLGGWNSEGYGIEMKRIGAAATASVDSEVNYVQASIQKSGKHWEGSIYEGIERNYPGRDVSFGKRSGGKEDRIKGLTKAEAEKWIKEKLLEYAKIQNPKTMIKRKPNSPFITFPSRDMANAFASAAKAAGHKSVMVTGHKGKVGVLLGNMGHQDAQTLKGQLEGWAKKNPYMGFKKLTQTLKRQGVQSPKALAAWIGRKKYGKAEFQQMALKGQRLARRGKKTAKKSNPDLVTAGQFLIHKAGAVYLGAPDNFTARYRLPDRRIVSINSDGWHVDSGSGMSEKSGRDFNSLVDWIKNEPSRLAAREIAEQQRADKEKEDLQRGKFDKKLQQTIDYIAKGMEKATGIAPEIVPPSPNRFPQHILIKGDEKVEIDPKTGKLYAYSVKIMGGKSLSALTKALAKYGSWEDPGKKNPTTLQGLKASASKLLKKGVKTLKGLTPRGRKAAKAIKRLTDYQGMKAPSRKNPLPADAERLIVNAVPGHKTYDPRLAVWQVKGTKSGKVFLNNVKMAEADKYIAKKYDEWRKHNPRRKNNPEIPAKDLYQKFHGQPSTKSFKVREKEHVHHNVTQLGTLVEIKVAVKPGGQGKASLFLLKASEGAASHGSPKAVHLTSNEDGTQLFLTGGDQSIDLKKLGFYASEIKEQTVVGTIQEITYRTQKAFDKFKTLDYYHGLGEENGNKPILCYKPRDKRMFIFGGDYEVRPEGIVN